jgi:hypothetical protein
MRCDELKEVMERLVSCNETPAGTRISTSCYYPSMDRVHVYVSRHRDGYRVTDSGEAARAAVLHGRGDSAIESGLTKAGRHYAVEVRDGVLVAEFNGEDWLDAAIIAVANAAAMAAKSAIEHGPRAPAATFVDRIGQVLNRTAPPQHIKRNFKVQGNSGTEWPVEYAILASKTPLFVKALKPHRTSVALNYSTFSDLTRDGGAKCFAVFDRPVKEESAALIRRVARLVPLRALEDQAREVLGRTAT